MKKSLLILLLIAACGGFGILIGYTIPRQQSVSSTQGAGFVDREWVSDNKIVAYVIPNEGPYYDLKWAGAEATLKELGYEPQKYSCAGYKDIKQHTDILENLIQRRVAGIILHPASETGVVPFVERAYDAGIPVIAENLEIHSPKVAGRVLWANQQVGWANAMAMVSAIGGKGKIVALVGPPGLEISEQMWQGAKEYFSRFPQVKIVREEHLGANSKEAFDRVESILTAHPDLDGIYTWFVQNAVGAAEAVRQKGYPPGKVKIVCKTLDPHGEALLEQGYISAVVVDEPIRMGVESARMLDDIRRGRQTSRLVVMRPSVVTKETLPYVDRTYVDWDAFQKRQRD